jgi:MFS family permease
MAVTGPARATGTISVAHPLRLTGEHGAHAAALLSKTNFTFANFKPTAAALPGGSTLLKLVDGLGGWALILAVAGLVIGAALWAIGSHSQNYQQSYVGRRAVLVSGVAALLIGAAPTLIGFFFNTGQGIVNPLAH